MFNIINFHIASIIKVSVLPSLTDHRIKWGNINIVIATTTNASREVWDIRHADWLGFKSAIKTYTGDEISCTNHLSTIPLINYSTTYARSMRVSYWKHDLQQPQHTRMAQWWMFRCYVGKMLSDELTRVLRTKNNAIVLKVYCVSSNSTRRLSKITFVNCWRLLKSCKSSTG